MRIFLVSNLVPKTFPLVSTESANITFWSVIKSRRIMSGRKKDKEKKDDGVKTARRNHHGNLDDAHYSKYDGFDLKRFVL